MEQLLSHFNSFCVTVELGARPLHKRSSLRLPKGKARFGPLRTESKQTICELLADVINQPSQRDQLWVFDELWNQLWSTFLGASEVATTNDPGRDCRPSRWHYRQIKNIFELIMHVIADADTDKNYFGFHFS